MATRQEQNQLIRDLKNRIHEMNVEAEERRAAMHALTAKLRESEARILPDRLSLTEVETKAVEMTQAVLSWAMASKRRVDTGKP
jgi:hypothetical protein